MCRMSTWQHCALFLGAFKKIVSDNERLGEHLCVREWRTLFRIALKLEVTFQAWTSGWRERQVCVHVTAGNFTKSTLMSLAGIFAPISIEVKEEKKIGIDTAKYAKK